MSGDSLFLRFVVTIYYHRPNTAELALLTPKPECAYWFMGERDVAGARLAQVGFLMRCYRDSFCLGGVRRGLTQEALSQRMGVADGNYGRRYSHATVSRWESGGTGTTLRRLIVFGKALNLSQAEVAGLILLAGLAPDLERHGVTPQGIVVTRPLAVERSGTRCLPPVLQRARS